MKIIEPSAEVFFHYPMQATDDFCGKQRVVIQKGELNLEKFLEQAGRTCYKSEDKVTSDSARKFISMLYERGHHAMLEHCFASVKFVTDRGVTHELVRHRLVSYAQECVTGDTVVHKKWTIKDLWEREQNKRTQIYNRRIQLKSITTNDQIIKNRIKNIFMKGVAPVFKVITSLGYTIKATKNHQFAVSNNKFLQLKDLKVGDFILVNGRPSVIKISNERLKQHYLDEGLSPKEIADLYGITYRPVTDRLKYIGIFVSHLNDKNKEKYNKNHTKESYEKMQKTIKKQYDNGRHAWNKDIKEKDNTSVQRQANNLRENHWNNAKREKNSNWRGGKDRKIAYQRKKHIMACEICGRSHVLLEVHHKDKNPKNNNIENLLKLCIDCHNVMHHGYFSATIAVPDKIISIDYVGEEPVYDLEMYEPHNYIANGFVVHNSTRYCNYRKDKFGGEISVIKPPGLDYETKTIWKNAMLQCEKSYLTLIEDKIPPQIARSVLPTCLKTEIWASANLREWMHIFKLRCAKTAHPQIREVMIKALEVFKDEVPSMFESLWEKYK